jgi:hypothetical protein
LGRWHVGGRVHNNGDRTGALTLSAFGVPEGEDVRDGDGVCRLLIEDIKDKNETRAIRSTGTPRPLVDLTQYR